jgi:hypothetical protein
VGAEEDYPRRSLAESVDHLHVLRTTRSLACLTGACYGEGAVCATSAPPKRHLQGPKSVTGVLLPRYFGGRKGRSVLGLC